jgi:cation transport regulator ChaC/energy-coupling factor transporter ATP-binding protein EcfA2
MWVFGYGSLMWDGWEQTSGGLRVDHAVLLNHRRSFNKKSVTNWGTSEAPAPTLGLEPGHAFSCVGTAFEFSDERRTAVETLLREREGPSFALVELTVRLPGGREVLAVTPVNDRSKPTYVGHIAVEERAIMARAATGTSGTCLDYVRNIHKKLESLGVVDTNVDEFLSLLEPQTHASTMKKDMPKQQEAPSHTPHALLPRWANNQDAWLRTIAGDVLKNRVEPSDLDIDRYLKLLLSEKKLSEEPFEGVPKIEEKEVDENPLEAVRVDGLDIGDGVNALKPGARIEFAPGVTVIFGENGSGKSGFVRVLKRAAGVRTAEDILHNVRTDNRPTPNGIFSVTVGAVNQKIPWKNEFGIAPLNRMSIFDARGARLHVEDDLTYVYTPGELTLFPLVQNAVERVRTALESAITARTPGPNTILASFDRSCSIYATIETLGAATDLDEIRKYAVLPENSDATIESMTIAIDALKSSNIQNTLRRSRDRAALVTALKAALQTATAFDVATYHSHVQTRDQAVRRRDEAGSMAFEGLGIAGVLSEEWRQFIQASEEYLSKHGAETYPKGEDPCAYCQQPLGAKAVELVRMYRDFSSNAIVTALDGAERKLRDYVAPILDTNIHTLQKQLAAETNGGPDVLNAITPVLEQIRELTVDIAARSAIEWQENGDALATAEAVVASENTRLAALITSLQASVEERQAALKTRQTELTELHGRKTANALLPQIEKRGTDAKWVARAQIVKGNVTGVLRSLTEAAKEAGEHLLNKDFGKRFEAECKVLRAPNVTLNFPGRQGQVTRRKLVGSYKPSQILSEGEQKALALADFLAEVTSAPASSPVVFDDPITSMDYRRIHEVCDRIVALSEDHQIIVFTHNIWFAAELLSKADKKNWKYYDIRMEAGDAGVVTAASHPRVDTIAQVSGRIKKLIDAAGTQVGEIKAALVEKGYEELRGFSEIVVEHEVLKDVVQRYAPNVMMTRLDKINVGKLQESVAAIVPIYDKSCRYVASHSQPPETQGIRPTLDELKADYETILKAREPHKT